MSSISEEGRRRLRTDDETISGFIHLGGYVAGGFLLLTGIVLLLAGF